MAAIAVLLVAIVLAIGKTAYDLTGFIKQPVDVATRTIVVDALDIVVLMEIHLILSNYRETERLDVVNVLDTTLFFVLRETLVEIAQQRLALTGVTTFAILLLTIGVLRIAMSFWAKDVHRAPQVSSGR